MSLAAGRLRHRVRIDRRVQTRDAFGGVVVTWAPLTGTAATSTVWAEIVPLSVREFIVSAAQESQLTTRITIRARAGLDATLRLVHLVNGVDGPIYNPAGFLADKESGLEYVTAPCSEGTSDGQ